MPTLVTGKPRTPTASRNLHPSPNFRPSPAVVISLLFIIIVTCIDIQCDHPTSRPMSDPPATEHPADPFQLLPKALYAPSSPISTPTSRAHLTDPELIAERVHAAIARSPPCAPSTPRRPHRRRVVIADAQARECIHDARALPNDPTPAMKCHAQANHCMRTANAARSLLLRVQAVRRKREAIQATCEQDAWTVRAAEGLLLAADGRPPPSRPRPRQSRNFPRGRRRRR